MARTPKTAGDAATPQSGDNLSPEEQERAWLIYYFDLARKQAVLVDRAKAAAKEASDALTTIYRSAKADADLTRKELSAYVADGQLGTKTLSAAEERRLRHKRWLGQPVGFQPDLFEDVRPQEVRDEAWARGLGYATGLRGDACELPDGMEARFANPFGEGWGKGQEELAWALSAVGRIVDRKPDANAAPIQLDPEPELEVDLDKAARAVKRSGFMDRSGPDADAALETVAA